MAKPDLALVLEAGPPKKKGPPLMAMDDEEEAPPASAPELATTPELEDAAGAVATAMASGDNAEIAKTLKGFIQLCGDY